MEISPKTIIQHDLVYDLGVNNGRDTEFYLSKGFRVVGIEANPSLYKLNAESLRRTLLTRHSNS